MTRLTFRVFFSNYHIDGSYYEKRDRTRVSISYHLHELSCLIAVPLKFFYLAITFEQMFVKILNYGVLLIAKDAVLRDKKEDFFVVNI